MVFTFEPNRNRRADSMPKLNIFVHTTDAIYQCYYWNCLTLLKRHTVLYWRLDASSSQIFHSQQSSLGRQKKSTVSRPNYDKNE